MSTELRNKAAQVLAALAPNTPANVFAGFLEIWEHAFAISPVDRDGQLWDGQDDPVTSYSNPVHGSLTGSHQEEEPNAQAEWDNHPGIRFFNTYFAVNLDSRVTVIDTASPTVVDGLIDLAARAKSKDVVPPSIGPIHYGVPNNRMFYALMFFYRYLTGAKLPFKPEDVDIGGYFKILGLNGKPLSNEDIAGQMLAIASLKGNIYFSEHLKKTL